MRNVTYITKSVFELVMAFTLLGFKVKKAVIISLVTITLLTIFNFFLMAMLNKFYAKMIAYKDDRADLSTDCVQGIKSIKYLGWEKLFENKIMALRK